MDSGGVGIPPGDEWGADYSHDLRAFRDAIREASPYVDAGAFARVEHDWHTYVERMLDYGNNGIVVPLMLELIDFSRDGSNRASAPSFVYGDPDPFVERHAAVRRHFGPLFDWTTQRGMKVFLGTDMLALTPPLHRHLQRLAPDKSAVGVDTSNPAVWDVYRAGLEELFDELPSVAGVVIRIGEGGSLYHSSNDWPYRSEMSVRDAAGLRAMLRGLLPVFEARHKTLVLRSWTVGTGRLGRLHVDPRIYETVLGGIDSPALIVSTKFTAGDFFSYLPLNRTLMGGGHRRLIEFQARPEFEGFGAFPNFLGEEHAHALRTLTRANPQIIGTYLWSQMGGPLRAGPRSLYPLHGFWLWTDANMFVTSRLALDPGADVRALAAQWASSTFGNDPRVAESITGVLMRSRRSVLDGMYIRTFAERELKLERLELPPLMWIFEWDMVGGWHSLLSVVYHGSRDAVDVATSQGDSAAALVRQSQGELRAAFALADPEVCARLCDGMLRSLEYQATLFEALAAWRTTFLNYYRWLDTGDRLAWTHWESGREWFRLAATSHAQRFGHDLDFPAFDFTSARQAVAMAERDVWVRRASGSLLLAMIALVTLGSPQVQRRLRFERSGTLAVVARLVWASTVAPWRFSEASFELPALATSLAIVSTLVAFVVGALTGFASARLTAGSLVVVGVAGITFFVTAADRGRVRQARPIVAAMGSLFPALIVLLAALTYFDAMGLWYRFWTSAPFRVCSVTVVLVHAPVD